MTSSQSTTPPDIAGGQGVQLHLIPPDELVEGCATPDHCLGYQRLIDVHLGLSGSLRWPFGEISELTSVYAIARPDPTLIERSRRRRSSSR